MKKPKTAVSGAINAILSATDILISNALPQANTHGDRAARLARAERDVAGVTAHKRSAMNRSAKLAEAERSVAQQKKSPRDIAICRAIRARRGW